MAELKGKEFKISNNELSVESLVRRILSVSKCDDGRLEISFSDHDLDMLRRKFDCKSNVELAQRIYHSLRAETILEHKDKLGYSYTDNYFRTYFEEEEKTGVKITANDLRAAQEKFRDESTEEIIKKFNEQESANASMMIARFNNSVESLQRSKLTTCEIHRVDITTQRERSTFSQSLPDNLQARLIFTETILTDVFEAKGFRCRYSNQDGVVVLVIDW